MRALALLLLAAAVDAPVPQSPAPPSPRPPDVMPLSRLRPDAVLPIALVPGAAATDDGLVVPTTDGLVAIAASSNAVAPPVLTGQRACSVLPALGALWAPLCDAPRIARVSTPSMGVAAPLELAVSDRSGRIAAGVGSVWALTDATGILSRIDPDTGSVVAEVRVAAAPSSAVFADGSVWVTSASGDTLSRVDAHTNDVEATVTVGPRPGRLVVFEGAAWTLNRGDGSVTRVDAKTNKVDATISIGPEVATGEIAAGEGAVWISAPGAPLVRIDPRTNRVTQRYTGEGGGAVVVAHGSVWVAADATSTWRLDPALVATLRP